LNQHLSIFHPLIPFDIPPGFPQYPAISPLISSMPVDTAFARLENFLSRITTTHLEMTNEQRA
jgi:hypothetical protein